MGEVTIKAQIYKGNEALTEMQVFHEQNLSELVKAVGKIKESINNYLTDLIVSNSGNKSQQNEDTDEEENEESPDALTGVLNELVNSDDKTSVKSDSSSNGKKKTKRRKR